MRNVQCSLILLLLFVFVVGSTVGFAPKLTSSAADGRHRDHFKYVAPGKVQRRKTCIVNYMKSKRNNTDESNGDDNGNGVSPVWDDIINSPVSRPLTLLLISQFFLFIGVGAVIPSIPLYGKELGFSGAANGIVISAPAVALVMLAQWAGRYADKARQPAMLYGMALIAMADFGTAVAPGLGVLLFARLALGAGRCISEAGERGLLADLVQEIPSLRGRALATQQAVTAVGIALGAPLGGIVVNRYGPRAAFLCVTAAALVALVLYAFLPETVGSTNGYTAEKDEADPSIEDSSISLDWAELIQQKQWQGLALCQSGASFGLACKISTIPILAADVLPGEAAGAGALLSAAGLAGLGGAPLGGWSTDRIGAKSTIFWSGLFSALSLFLVPFALGNPVKNDFASLLSLTLPFSERVVLEGPALLFCLAVLGWSMGAAAQVPALTALAQQEAPPNAQATALALPRAAGDGTYIVAPFLLGLAADKFTAIRGIECAVAASAIVIGLVALLVSDLERSEN